MSWICTSCGWTAKTSRRKCRKCGSMRWRPRPQKDPGEISGPIKQITPTGFLLANPGKQAPDMSSNEIECGKCHTVIYRPEKEFDMTTFKAVLKGHYSTSPDCAD